MTQLQGILARFTVGSSSRLITHGSLVTSIYPGNGVGSWLPPITFTTKFNVSPDLIPSLSIVSVLLLSNASPTQIIGRPYRICILLNPVVFKVSRPAGHFTDVKFTAEHLCPVAQRFIGNKQN